MFELLEELRKLARFGFSNVGAARSPRAGIGIVVIIVLGGVLHVPMKRGICEDSGVWMTWEAASAGGDGVRVIGVSDDKVESGDGKSEGP